MKKLILSTTALVMLTGSTALALDNLETETIVAEFATAQRIEIKRGMFRTKVEVFIDGQVIEVVYDNATFEEVKREEAPMTDEDIAELEEEGLGLEVEIEDEDDLDDEDDNDDDDDDDDDDDNDDDDDDDDDDLDDDLEDDQHEEDDHDEDHDDDEDDDEDDDDEDDEDEDEEDDD